MSKWSGAFSGGVVCLFLLSGCAGLRPAGERPHRLTLADDGASEFSIVVADDASPSTRHAAVELRHFLREMTDAELRIVDDSVPVSAHEIILGDNAHLKKLGVDIDFDELGDEGYVIRTVGPHLVIAGGELRGNLYGVYGLLEDHLGCRWFTPDVSDIPEIEHLVLDPVDDVQVPVLEYREPFTIDCFDGDWCARNRVNSSAGHLEEKHGGKVRFGNGMFVHTFNRLVPPDKYFDEHPEYFSEIDGKRVKERTQLCCTNEEVVRLCIENTIKAIEADPGAYVFSVSQNDWGNYCQCENCQRLARAEDSQMAPVLYLVNRVAEAVEKKYPDKAIETLAYQWTRKPPRTMRPRDNVIIRLCSIECDFMQPLATSDFKANEMFRKDAEAWADIADRLWVWNYVTSFRHFLCPFPNLHVRKPNIRFFIKNNVTGIFEQDNYRSLNGELSALNGYITAKFLWDPDYDEDKAINEFLRGVYGDAARPIRRYINMLEHKVNRDNLHANIWIGPVEAPYLNERILEKTERLWDYAERAVEHDPKVLERVKIARLPVEYAIIERTRAERGKVYEHDHANFRIEAKPEFADRVRRFFEVARRADITWIDEWRVSLDKYEEQFKDILEGAGKSFEPRSPVDVANPSQGLRYSYYEGKFEALPDFDALEPKTEGSAKRFDLDIRERDTDYAIKYTGYFRAERDGIYTFHCRSNDGSKLYIGPKLVVDNGGLHGAKNESGQVGLEAGLHPIAVTFFQSGGSALLDVSYEGPGRTKRFVPAGLLFHD